VHVLAIDPGAHGAIALVDVAACRIVSIADMPTQAVTVSGKRRTRVDARGVADIIRSLPTPSRVILEQVGARRGEGVVSSFSFGRASGIIEGVIAGFGYDLQSVTPQAWRKFHRLQPGKTASRELAMELFPDDATRFKRVKDDGRAEAALMALYEASSTASSTSRRASSSSRRVTSATAS
jgi:crossover junction endodeoxyribonuclease RuvC